MGSRIVIIQGHPDKDPGRYCRALADAYAEGAKAAGHSVTRVDLADLHFPLLGSQDEFMHGAVPKALEPARKAISEARHVVLVFPLWLGTMPALVKAFLEQVMRPGVAFSYREKGLPEMLMKGRSARIVVTMGMPAVFYRWWYLSHGVRGLERNILRFVGMKPVRTTLIGMVESLSDAKRRKWLDRMRALGREAA